MTKRMLIDTSHAEETRVVVLDSNRLEDYDVETAAKKQLKGNIYLAKVVRVEPSLQAAFVEYGGNRHGFLAFAEIHPDYYQIPVADRLKLIAAQEEEARAEEARAEAEQERAEALAAQRQATRGESDAEAADDEPSGAEAAAETDERAEDEAGASDEPAAEGEILPPESLGGEDDRRDTAPRRPKMRHYTIQEVIRRRQILLVQVVKEERGNKGAALTTYISLAGRFCVLMPNSLRDGGVSRKITSAADRRRLKEITAELEIPRGMGMIVRTAGAQRPRAEIKRDCEYLLELWDEIRERTLASVAPALIHEEASLIRRAIRDGYSRDIEEVVVDGEPGWRSVREFMRTLMPDHTRKVQLWNGNQPLFSHYQVEGHLDSLHNPTVQLRSGGYLVINQTEALVAIDVNSGRATRERGIEETAFRTNMEAADEVARQLRLRDLAGLIVIDFIDMESRRHNSAVERRLKEALKDDRARIQVGSISAFGLMEMSRQRLRPSVAESSLSPCPHCAGTGMVRGTESAALHVLRVIGEEGAKRRAAEILVHVASPVAIYVLNHKRVWLAEIEARYGLVVNFAADDSLLASQVRIDRTRVAEPVDMRAARAPDSVPLPLPQATEAAIEESETEDDEDEAGELSGAPDSRASSPEAGDDQRRRRRRRRRRGGRRDDASPMPLDAEQPDIADHAADAGDEPAEASVASEAEDGVPEDATGAEGAAAEEAGRRRGRRGGRRRGRDRDRERGETAAPAPAPVHTGPTPADPFGDAGFDIFEALEGDSAHRSGPLPASVIEALAAEPVDAAPMDEATGETSVAPPSVLPAEPVAAAEAETAEPAKKPRRSRRKAETADTEPAATEMAAETAAPAAKPRRTRAKAAAETAPLPEAEPAKPARRSRRKTAEPVAAEPVAAVAEDVAVEPAVVAVSEEDVQAADNAPKPVLIEAGTAPAAPRAGWWRR
ncbi:Rne/Rng family ribonuclease [Endobacter medicaginis]